MRARRVLFAAAAVGLGTVAALGLAEIVLRVHNPFGSRLRGAKIMLPAYRRYRIVNDALPGVDPVVVHTRNALGFRGPEPPADFASRFTVVAVGGSTTECFYLSDGKSWPERLGALLERARPGVWVNNAGLDGHSTHAHLLLLEETLIALKPKVVLFLIGINDLTRDSLPPAQRELLDHVKDGKLGWLAAHSEVVALALDAARSHMARGVSHAPLVLKRSELPPLPEAEKAKRLASWLGDHRADLEAYRERVLRLCRESRAAGIEPVLLTQPLLWGEGEDPATHVALGDLPAEGGTTTTGLMWRHLEAYNDVTRRVAAEEHALLVDLARELPKDSRYFYDHVHYTNAGAERVAQIVAAALSTKH